MSHIHIVVVFHDKVVYYKQLAFHCVLADIELKHFFHGVLLVQLHLVKAHVGTDEILELIG